jgi:hypothetical protein
MGFSVNALFYGDHAPLAARLLDGLLAAADWSLIDEIRFAFNDVCEVTRRCVTAAARVVPVPCYLYEEVRGRNVGKYPLLRRMLYDTQYPLSAARLMWFDDDTYLRPETTRSWWRQVWELSQRYVMLGSRYNMTQRGLQYKAIPQQPWYNGQPVGKFHRYKFFTGGWWVADPTILRKWNYPFPELHHNGGDTLLGELMRQQDYPVFHFNNGIAINADDKGVESNSPRRGTKSVWPWQESRPTDLSHHDFQVRVTAYGQPRKPQHRDPGPLPPCNSLRTGSIPIRTS